MKEKTMQWLQLTETDLGLIWEKLEKFSDEKLNTQPQQGKWSVLQVLAHIFKSERIATVLISKQLTAEKPLHQSKLSSVLKYALLRLTFFLGIKIKAPDAVANPEPIQDRKKLMKDFEKVRAQLRVLIDKFPDSRIEEKVYKHPRLGPLNLSETLRFLYHHQLHHLQQIEKILKQ